MSTETQDNILTALDNFIRIEDETRAVLNLILIADNSKEWLFRSTLSNASMLMQNNLNDMRADIELIASTAQRLEKVNNQR